MRGKGKVYLVGAGPGDPGLMTIKGRQCLESADVVVYDFLANRTFLEYAGENAELIYVGKKGGCHTMRQEDINSLIVEKAGMGLTVVRLKGGDPFIFGRGGEEAQELVEAGVDYEVVPGVTSAIAVPAYAGIPLTHRDYTSSVAFVTGHENPDKGHSDIAWDRLADGVGTLVFLMGVGNLGGIAKKLMQHGKGADTPVAVIMNGTSSMQKTITGRLDNIREKAELSGIRPPAIIVVGGVAGLRDQLKWFEKRPLLGRRIVVTRAREQASGFLKRLGELGAECIEFPTIEILPAPDWNRLDEAIRALDKYDWLLFTSVNGVKYFFMRLKACGKDVRDLSGIRIGAIGPKTAEILNNMGIMPDIIPDEYRAEALVEQLGQAGITGAHILIPRAEKAREILPEELRKKGANVDVVTTYRTVLPDRDREEIVKMFERGQIDMVTFTSSSTVKNFCEIFSSSKTVLKKWMSSVSVASIGPITSETAVSEGFSVDLVPAEYTIEALTESIVEFFGSPADPTKIP